MSAYPYPYPPQPVVYGPLPVQPPTVVYGPPPPVQPPTVVQTKTKIVHQGYGQPSFGGGKPYGRKDMSYGVPTKSTTSKKSFNLLTVNKTVAPKPSSSKASKDKSKKTMPKIPGAPLKNKKKASLNVPGVPSKDKKSKKPTKSSALPKDKKKTTRRRKSKGQKKSGARLRDAPDSIGAMFGPQLSLGLSDEYTLRALLDKLSETGRTADSAVRRFMHALFGLVRDHGGVLPRNTDLPLDVQYMVALAVHSRRMTPMRLTFVNENGERFEAVQARPFIDNARVASATFVLPEGTKTSLNGRFAVEIAYGDLTYKHSDVFAEHPRTIHGDGHAFHWMINLYDAAHSGNYYKYLVPLPTLELTMARSRTEENTYLVSEAALVVDYEPRKHFVTLPAKGSDIAQVPALLPRSHAPYKAFVRDNMTLNRALHEQLLVRIGALMEGSANKWEFSCSGGTREGQDVFDHRVFLGTADETAVAYAVMTMLKERKMLQLINDPEMIKETLGGDENGRRAVEVVGLLYDKYHAALGKEPTSAHQRFPSLLQLLLHSSGLPAARSLNCDQVRAYYLKVIGILTGSDQEPAMVMTYDQREAAVLAEFAKAPGADNDADVSLGQPHNTLEAFLVAMFVRRFNATSPTTMRNPGDIVNSFLQPNDFKLEWGASLTEASQAQMMADPLVFSTCATTTFSGLTSHVRMLADELAQPSRADSIFFKMLSVRIRVEGEDESVAHSVGWTQQRVNDKLDVLFVGSVNDTVDTVVAAIVPQLSYFAVFHEMSADFDQPLRTNVDAIVDTLIETLNVGPVRAQYEGIPQRTRLSVTDLSRANKAWDASFLDDLPDDFVVGVPLPADTEVFFDPFVVQTQRRLRPVQFQRADPSGVTAFLVFNDDVRVPLVYDPRRGGYFVQFFDGTGSALGPEAVITKEYIQFDGEIYIRGDDFAKFSKDYVNAYNTARQLADADVFRTRQSEAIKSGTLVTLTPGAAFSLERRIGAVVVPVPVPLPGVGVWGPVAPGYPYGYPYGYPGGVSVPIIYGPWERRPFHRHGRWGYRGPWRR